jgi:diguanylate cyclase (GGDEF)-like protein
MPRTGSPVRSSTRRAWAIGLALTLAVLAPPLPAETEYGRAEGLSQNSAMTLARDDEGFVWIGTEDGLNRFDGYDFRHYRPESGSPLAAGATYIRGLAASGRHLFLATNGGGLGVFDRIEERFRLLGLEAGLPAEYLTAVEATDARTLYLGSRNGLARLEWQGDPMHDTPGVLRLEMPPESTRRDIWSLHLGPSGLWVASGDGVLRVDAQQRLVTVPVPGSQAPFNTDALLEFPAGVLWIGSWDQGLFRLELDSGSVRQFLPGQPDSPGLRSARVLSLAQAPGGVVFAGTDRGLAWFDPECDCLKSLDHRRAARVGGHGFILLSLLADAHGGLFAGFWGEGLVRFTPNDRVFHVERPREQGPPGLAHNRVRGLLEDREGRLWVGSFGAGVQRVATGHRVQGLPWRFESLPFPEGVPDVAQLVWTLMQDRSGRIWAGTDDGLYWTEPGAVRWRRERPLGEAVPMPGVRAMLEDRQGRLWIASSNGLGRIDAVGAERQRFPIAVGGEDDPFRRQDESLYGLYLDAESRLWVGSSGGLHILDGEGNVLARYRAKDGLPGPVVWSIHRHQDGSLWLGTSGGLARVVNEAQGVEAISFEPAGRRSGLPPGGVTSLATDRDGNLWLSGNHGLIRFAPESGAFRVWTQREGIAADETGTNALLRGGDGRLFLAGIDGITAFDPRQLREQLETPRPRLSRGESGGLPLPLAADRRSLRLAHDHRPLVLDFTGLVYDLPGTARFRYRLSPLAEYTELGQRRSLILDGLPHGQHRLEVAVDNQGRSAADVLLEIEVVPPLTATWSFRLAVAGSLILLLALLYLWRVRALTAQRRRLESQVATRTRELRAQKEALEATAEALVVANDRLRTLSTVDTLTGLPNRRGLIERIQATLDAAPPGPGPALAIIDLDHFKQINDAHGHLAGDDVLRDFAALLGQALPEGATAGRWGGEEFLAVFDAESAGSAAAWAEHLLARVRERHVRHADKAIDYRISLGLAVGRGGDDIDALTARADRALYAAKQAGRDRLQQALD